LQALFTSYDLENYQKFYWAIDQAHPSGFWNLMAPFYTLEELQCTYGDSCGDLSFNPLLYSFINPLLQVDSLLAFLPLGNNLSRLGIDTPIRKIYPGQPYPTSLIPDSAQNWELTSDGYLKYFEYEVNIPNLLPGVDYCASVTAFDAGLPWDGVPSLETGQAFNLTCLSDSPCCLGVRGNIDGSPDDQIDIGDLVFIVDYMYQNGSAPICPEEADPNSSGATDISDLTYMVDYVFRNGAPPADCPL